MSPAGQLGFEFRLLGTFEVISGGRVLAIGSSKQQALLALLVTHLNRVVSLDAIGEELWEGRPPASLGATVQSLVYRVRKVLFEADAEAAGVALRGRGSGYVLEGEQLQVDAHRFERLAARARELAGTGAAETAAKAFRDALAQWRGPALDGLTDLAFARLEAARLGEARLLAVEGLAKAELARDLPEEALRLLEPHVATNPLREAACGQLMLTLYRLGRQAEALRAYQELRRVLAEELGLEPNPALRELERQILAQSPELDSSPVLEPAPGSSPVESVPERAPLAAAPPTGDPLRTLTTVMFTDVEGSTDLRTRCGDDAAQKLLRDHEDVVRALVAEHGGREVKALGDGFLVTFASARGALNCAAAIQRAFEARRWASPDEGLKLRIGVNAGEVVQEGGDVFGQAVHATARVAAKANGGQVLVSELVCRLVGSVPDLAFRDAGSFRLKGFDERWRLFELMWAEARPAVSPIRDARTPLVGRDAELAELRHALEQAMSGSGRLVMLAGEAGIGKTRLTEELTAEALRNRALVFVGRCLEAEGAPAYAPFVEILESALAQAPSPEAFRAAAGDGAPEIARLVPRLRRLFPDIGPALTLPPEQERHYLFSSVFDMVARTARAVPTVYILEDLHWADEATLLLLDHVAQHMAELPLLVVGTYRDVELPVRPLLARALEGLVRQRLLLKMTLSRLPQDGVARMLHALAGQEPPAAVTSAVYAETEGNPFFMEEVFRHLVEEGRLLDADGQFRTDLSIGDLDVPENIRLVLGRRLDRLGESARRVLGAAAVLGRSFSFELLESLAELSLDDLLDTVDNCERAQLIAPAPGDLRAGDRYLFSHELVRQTLLAELSAPRRRRLHLRVAEAMESLYADHVDDHARDLARHLAEAGSADRDRLFHYSVIAGRQAMAASAFEEGVRHFEQALALEKAGHPQRAELFEHAGQAYRAVGRLDDALTLWNQSLEIYEALGEAESIGRICQEAGLQLGWATRWDEAVDMTRRGLRALEGRPSLDQCRLFSMLGALLGGAGLQPAALSVLEEGMALADRLGDDLALGYALSGKTCYEFCYLAHPAALDAGLRSAALLRSGDDLSQAAMTLGWTAVSLVHAGRWQEAGELVDELDPLAERLGSYPALIMTKRARGMRVFFEHGDLDELEAFGHRDLEFIRTSGLGFGGMSLTWLGLAEFLRGRWPEALPLFHQGAEQEAPGVLDGTNSACLFEYLAYLGHTEEALALLGRWEGRLPRVGQPALWGVWQMLFSVVEGLVMLGEDERAASFQPLVVDALGTGSILGSYHDGRLLQRVAGIAAAAGRRWEAAEGHFEAALRLAGELPHPIEGLHTRRFYGWMLLRRGSPGDRERGAGLLTAAAAGYRSFGMARHAHLAEALLTA
jgi:class 3 adenylate cyclase/DNA-binding winged helix-turn-helix (wHTH) protein